ncbi:low-density lipoprotein receptor-related protein 2-like isoform X2 [Anneissia japonica]|uniref:low-density lipoprotein receptor-related protein 2-like isoform X2 n=1 Tax=Anneissia japonica TaxID=1529436 RepID=UPI001425AE6E|nr:low-density lipoprotein receptor-related protein 2-like isoform X2 [Anneissia japonica]
MTMRVCTIVPLSVFFVCLAVFNICYADCTYDSSWCKNGGYCDYSQRRCICPLGFAGKRCETGLKYMLNECSKFLYLNTTDTLVLKSQSSSYVPADVYCEVYLRPPSSRHQILVNIDEFSMHSDCKHSYLQFGNREKFCGLSYMSQYVLPEATTMYLKLGHYLNHEHYGFIMTISTFVPQSDFYFRCYWPDDFACDNRRCVSSFLLNDGFDNCGDGSDEFVTDLTCDSDEHKCFDRCIPRRWKCDCNSDCIVGEDEWGCDCRNQDANCAPNEIWCEHTQKCIYYRSTCYKDIWTTPSANCAPDEIWCERTQTCIYYRSTCYKDIWTTPTNEECQGREFLCEDSYKCIPMDFVCDNYVDCDDESDENNCPATCAPNKFWCEHTQTCIYYGSTCSEHIRTTPTNKECQGKEFLCEDSYKCIPMDFVCDNYVDCDDESDENNCRVSSGVLTGIVLASMLSLVCFVGASLLVVSIVLKRRQERERRNNDIRTVSAYVPPEPQNLYTNCDIPPSYEIAVGIDKEALEDKESVSPESKSNSDFEEGEDPSFYDLPDFDDCFELPLVNAISEIAKTQPPHL